LIWREIRSGYFLESLPNRERYKFFYELRVRYAEIDGQGIVFNAHYFTYFDTAVTEYLRQINLDYQALVREEGLDFYLVRSSIDYIKPVIFDQVLEIGVTAAKFGRSSLTWDLAIFDKGEKDCLTHGELVWVCTNRGTNKSHPLPGKLLQLLNSN
jgi:acyl-CoA thioester hydrolase